MGKDASKLMTERTFWNIIESSERGHNLEECLSPLSEDELFGFRYWWDYFLHKTYKQDIWAAAYIVLGGCSDDSFEYFRYWLIAQGHEAVYNALANADSLCDVFDALEDPEGDDYPEQEDLNYAVQDVIAKRTGDIDYYYEALENYSLPTYEEEEIEFEWDEDDEESLRAVCPRIFDRWWDNQ